MSGGLCRVSLPVLESMGSGRWRLDLRFLRPPCRLESRVCKFAHCSVGRQVIGQERSADRCSRWARESVQWMSGGLCRVSLSVLETMGSGRWMLDLRFLRPPYRLESRVCKFAHYSVGRQVIGQERSVDRCSRWVRESVQRRFVSCRPVCAADSLR